jgi:predicted lipoprotein with Yx(FWY)xxD motif
MATSHRLAARHKVAAASFAVIAASGAAAASAAPAATAQHQKISSVKISIGRVVSSPSGMVMYLFEKDTKNVSHCSGVCQTFWPPVMSSGAPVAGAHISSAHLGRTSAGQVTYYGHPLYYYVGDSQPKQDRGQGSNGSGGKWYVVSTGGKAIT